MTGWEVAAALLTAVGLASLGWLAVGWLVSPGRPERDVKVYVVLRAAGDGEELEQAARRLRWLESGSGGLSIVIADDGLTEVGRRRAELLFRRWPGVILCRWDRVADLQ